MDHAWLDSLSEDWVSQPRSAGSPVQSLPSLSNSTSSNARAASSRIPTYNDRKQSWTAQNDRGDSPLSERSTNEINIPLSQRAQLRPSKLREITIGTRGRRISRTLSESSTQTTQCHTVQHKSTSLSPRKMQDTPEWKKRLLHGDVAYGEQKDLFSPAGLENMFRPPPAQSQSPSKLHPNQGREEDSIVMPSSPPLYRFQMAQVNTVQSDEDVQEQGPARNGQQPRTMNYRLASDAGSEFSANDLSQSNFSVPANAPLDRSGSADMRSEPISEPDSSVVHRQDAGRVVSGQSDVRNEELSPIYISRHNTVDGQVDYAALDLPADELQRRLAMIRDNSLAGSEKENDVSNTLPGDMTTETDDFAHNGRFVNLRRGGRSQEGSFQKRMLSLSSLPAIEESILPTEESMQASTPKQLPNIQKTRASNEYKVASPAPNDSSAPHTPLQSPRKGSDKDAKGSSGSPLKIFGTYDTFTNQKLLRRLSQFEGDMNQPSSNDVSRQSADPQVHEGNLGATNPEKVSQQNHTRNRERKMSSFGAGELDNFQFSESLSYDSDRSNDQDDKETLSLPVLKRNGQTPFKFQLQPSPDLSDGAVVHHRARYTNTMTTTETTTSVRKTVRARSSSPDSSNSSVGEAEPTPQPEDLRTPRKRNGDSDGKRLLKTPQKDPTPKRRRTLHETELVQHVSVDKTGQDSLKDTHDQMQSIVGRKRKDARHGDSQQAANPTVLAMRQILRPRMPTPSQRSSQQLERAPLQEIQLDSDEKARLLQEQKIAMVQAELDSTDPMKLSAALGVGQHMFDDNRKGSVTTQDFLDEAKKIMAGIRGKTRPRSGLTSLEESESENDRAHTAESGTPDGELEDSYQESTKEPFSRPPSRDGKPVSRLPLKQEDPALLDHLRKYQERSDMDGVIASSIKSLAMIKEVANAAKEIDRLTEETIARKSTRPLLSDDAIESDPPNIRLSENPDADRKRKHSTSSVRTGDGEANDAEFPSQGSNASSSQSTTRSIPTGSSKNSETRRVIAPHTVSHLIPEQLAGMVFDREANRWVKRKTSSETRALNFLPSDETEDDPFGDIPDLSVNETQELQRIKAVAKRKEEAEAAQENPNSTRQDSDSSPAWQALSKDALVTEEDIARPSMKSRSSDISLDDTASGLSRSKTAQGLDKRVSSIGPALKEDSLSSGRPAVSRTDNEEEILETVEQEISIHQDRVDVNTPRRKRNVTITFSSPLETVIQASDHDRDSHHFEQDHYQPQSSDDGGQDESIIVSKRKSKKKTTSTRVRTTSRSTSQRMSIRAQRFPSRPVSRIDEQDEESNSELPRNALQRSVSIVASTPLPAERETSVVLATPRPGREVGTLTLTPLSDFTVHHADVSLGLDVSYVAQGQRFNIGNNNNKRTLSLSIKELVEKLSEVEPYEPFWEHMKELDLKDKRLTNLHKLDEFCEGLASLNVSHNQIGQLDGVPRSIRNLRITHNCLTDLAAWNHLLNLQYIDVSNNELESLSAFKSLIHLRGLRADNNNITSLDGVGGLDGLLSLRARNNIIQAIDFSGTKLKRLSDLDLKGNNIDDVRNLAKLRSLSTLNLDDNDLSHLSMDDGETMGSMRQLKLSGNDLESFDASPFPELRLLYLDRNRLGTVSGLRKAKTLDSLSMRQQQEGAIVDKSFLADCFEVRKLFLSGNFLGTFQPRVDFLNLQYLELANCGLEIIPEGFGYMVSNVRILNLNFNALKDIKPLMGIVRLKRLDLAGNRIARLVSLACTLAQFGSLTSVDVRNNPLTLGFYPPVTDTRLVVHGSNEAGQEAPAEPFTLGPADRGKDERYTACLDMRTRMLRRVFEMMVLSNCARLETLDGLDVDRPGIQIRDQVWGALINAGILEDLNGSETAVESEMAPEDVHSPAPLEESERWQGEDSFA